MPRGRWHRHHNVGRSCVPAHAASCYHCGTVRFTTVDIGLHTDNTWSSHVYTKPDPKRPPNMLPFGQIATTTKIRTVTQCATHSETIAAPRHVSITGHPRSVLQAQSILERPPKCGYRTRMEQRLHRWTTHVNGFAIHFHATYHQQVSSYTLPSEWQLPCPSSHYLATRRVSCRSQRTKRHPSHRISQTTEHPVHGAFRIAIPAYQVKPTSSLMQQPTTHLTPSRRATVAKAATRRRTAQCNCSQFDGKWRR